MQLHHVYQSIQNLLRLSGVLLGFGYCKMCLCEAVACNIVKFNKVRLLYDVLLIIIAAAETAAMD